MKIEKPLLAGKYDSSLVKYPVYVTPKIDGIRVLKINNEIVSRSLKPIRNEKLVKLLQEILPEGSDGEVVLKNASFQDTVSFVMSSQKEWLNNVEFYWFDYVKEEATKGYLSRIKDMQDYSMKLPDTLNIVMLIPTRINDASELLSFETKVLSDGFEGVMIRKGDGKYKFGRSTTKECILLKLKRFEDNEATIIGFEQKKSLNPNNNPPELGSFIVGKRFKNEDITFSIGTGLSQNDRIMYWERRNSMIGKLLKFKYFNVGVLNAPRHPVFIGIRDIDDT